MRSTRVWRTVWLGVMTGLGALLMYLEVPLPLFPTYLKYDLGDLPALLIGLALGPGAGITVELGKEALFMLLRGGPVIGVAANLVVGVVWVGAAGLIYRRRRTNAWAAVSVGLGGLTMVGVMAVANWFVFLPLWGIPAEAIPATVTTLIVPFNIIKAILTGVVAVLLYSKIREHVEESQLSIPYDGDRRTGSRAVARKP